MFATLLAEFLNACSRIEDVLLLPEDSDTNKFNPDLLKLRAVNPKVENKAPKYRSVYEIRNLTARYPGAEESSLKNISASIQSGKLTGVIGAVGCGKRYV